jgi:hypothetical protein
MMNRESAHISEADAGEEPGMPCLDGSPVALVSGNTRALSRS